MCIRDRLKTLLRNPRIGDNILYRVGDHDTYFIPVYTAGAGGVVAQLGTIAAVGAGFTGEYYVGLGATQEEAFEAYLQKLSGIIPTSRNGDGVVQLDKEERIEKVLSIFEEKGLVMIKPTSIQIPISFLEGEIVFYTESDLEDTETMISDFVENNLGASPRIMMWEDESVIYLGTVKVVEGIAELHYISIQVGK